MIRLRERFRLWRIERRLKSGGTLADVRWCLQELGLPVNEFTDQELVNGGHALGDALRDSGLTVNEIQERLRGIARQGWTA